VAHQVPHDFQQVGERFFLIDENRGGDVTRANQSERLPDVSRGVVEAGLAGDFGVVEQGRIQVHLALVGAAAEEVDGAAAADHVDGPLPCLLLADGFDGDVHAAPVRHFADRFHRVAVLPGHDQVVGAESRRAIQLGLPSAHRDHAATVKLGQFDEHQPNRTQTDNGDGIAGAGSRFLKTAHDTRQRFHQGRILIADFVGNKVCIALHDARREADVLGIGAVVEEQVLAQILQAAVAEETLSAGRRIGRHHALPNREIRDSLANGDDIPRQFVPKHGRWHDHPSVVSTSEDFDIGAAGERHLYPYEDVSAFNCGNSYRLYLQMLLAVKHSSHHVVIHL